MSGMLDLTDLTLPAGPAYKNIADFLRLALSVSSGLVGLYQLGGSEASSLVNLANAAAPLTNVGAPTINTIGATTDNKNCFDTGLPETTEFTFLGVTRYPSGADLNSMVVSNFNNAGGTIGSSLYRTTSNLSCAAPTSTSSNATSNLSDAAPDTNWRIEAGRADTTAAVVQSHRSISGVVTNSPTQPRATTATAARTLRIGGHYASSQFTGSREIAAVAIWNRALSLAELTTVYAEIRAFYAKLGITTL